MAIRFTVRIHLLAASPYAPAAFISEFLAPQLGQQKANIKHSLNPEQMNEYSYRSDATALDKISFQNST